MKHEMPIISVEEITPDDAASILAKNDNNRSIRKDAAAAIARDIAAGNWKFNGDAIRIDTAGNLIDGQHRLKACIIAETPIKTVVVRNLDNSARVTIDAGRARTNSDRLRMSGVKNASHLSSTIRVLAAISANVTRVALTGSEQQKILSDHPGIEQSVARCRNSTLGFSSMMCATHYIIKSMDGDDAAEDWALVWDTGQPAYDGDALVALRQRIIRLVSAGSKLHQVQKILLICNAVNNWRMKKSRVNASQAKEAKIEGWRGL